MKRFTIFLLLTLLSLWLLLPKLDGSNGFKDYLVSELGSRGVPISVSECSTEFGRSRGGFCSFSITESDHTKLHSVLELRKFVPLEGNDEAFSVRGSCVDKMHLTHSEKGNFGVDKKVWNAGASAYVINNPPEHDKTKNIRLLSHLRFSDMNAHNVGKQNVIFYDANSKEYCIELEYPYG